MAPSSMSTSEPPAPVLVADVHLTECWHHFQAMLANLPSSDDGLARLACLEQLQQLLFRLDSLTHLEVEDKAARKRLVQEVIHVQNLLETKQRQAEEHADDELTALALELQQADEALVRLAKGRVAVADHLESVLTRLDGLVLQPVARGRVGGASPHRDRRKALVNRALQLQGQLG